MKLTINEKDIYNEILECLNEDFQVKRGEIMEKKHYKIVNITYYKCTNYHFTSVVGVEHLIADGEDKNKLVQEFKKNHDNDIYIDVRTLNRPFIDVYYIDEYVHYIDDETHEVIDSAYIDRERITGTHFPYYNGIEYSLKLPEEAKEEDTEITLGYF